MTLSIIIPVYNVDRYLPACVNSVISQAFTDWELLLIDDGSTDKSGVICDDFAHKDSRIHAIHTSNQGPSSARNLGISHALGDFVTFIDSDDFVRPSFLSHFSYNTTLDFEIQGFHLCYLSDPSKDKDVMPLETKVASVGEIYAEAELNKLSRGPVCKLFKRSIIVDNGIEYPLGINFAEDAIFVKRYLVHCNGKARSISAADYIYNHYQSSDSLTSRRHSGQMMYDASFMDYELFLQLDHIWGNEITEDVKRNYVHLRALEFYNSICLFLTESGQSMSSCMSFLTRAKYGMYKHIKREKNLPPTYRFIYYLMGLPAIVSVPILKLFFIIKKPGV